jgi:hypothetical protein
MSGKQVAGSNSPQASRILAQHRRSTRRGTEAAYSSFFFGWICCCCCIVGCGCTGRSICRSLNSCCTLSKSPHLVHYGFASRTCKALALWKVRHATRKGFKCTPPVTTRQLAMGSASKKKSTLTPKNHRANLSNPTAALPRRRWLRDRSCSRLLLGSAPCPSVHKSVIPRSAKGR